MSLKSLIMWTVGCLVLTWFFGAQSASGRSLTEWEAATTFGGETFQDKVCDVPPACYPALTTPCSSAPSLDECDDPMYYQDGQTGNNRSCYGDQLGAVCQESVQTHTCVIFHTCGLNMNEDACMTMSTINVAAPNSCISP